MFNVSNDPNMWILREMVERQTVMVAVWQWWDVEQYSAQKIHRQCSTAGALSTKVRSKLGR